MRDDLKELLKNAKSEEEAMQILADNKIELTDEELEELRGGTAVGWDCYAIATAATGCF